MLPIAQSRDEQDTRRVAFLTDYQNRAYAKRYEQLVARVKAAEEGTRAGSTDLTDTVAESYFCLLPYKDEYEVDRAWADPVLMRKVGSEFAGDFMLKFHLAPPH